MICNYANRCPVNAACPEGSPHLPAPRTLPHGFKVEAVYCCPGSAVVEVKLIPAVDGRQGKLF